MYRKSNSALIMFSFFLLIFLLLCYLGYSLWLGGDETNGEHEDTAITPINLSGVTVRLWHTAEQTVEEIPLEELVYRTLAGEMPASAPDEALRAQAVAARTYIAYRLNNVSRHEEQNADVCDDYHHCQEYMDDEELQQKWGDGLATWEYKLKSAVEATSGEVLMYQNALIDPLYHSVCGGMTEAAGDYWSVDLPCMQSVPCIWDSDAKKYQTNVIFSAEELAEKLGVSAGELPEMKIVAYSPTGRVKEVVCGDHSWSGVEMRTALALNSTNFSWLSDGERYNFYVRGYGHGVGMCQSGAIGMAKEGKTYRDILQYYYSGAEVVNLTE